MADELIIHDLRSLQRWRAGAKAIFAPSALPHVKFDLPPLSRSDNHQLTLEATRLHSSCGCTAAGLAMTMAVLFAAVSISLDSRGPLGVPLLSFAGYLSLIVGAAMVAKVLNLLWTRWRMIRLADDIKLMITHRSRCSAH